MPWTDVGGMGEGDGGVSLVLEGINRAGLAERACEQL